MRGSIFIAAVLVGILVFQPTVPGHQDSTEDKSAGKNGLKLETLLKATLEGVDDTEVILILRLSRCFRQNLIS